MEEERKFKVYMHRNKTNGKIYIGITGQKLEDRWREGKGYKGCRAFSSAIKKYGWDGFEHILLFNGLTKEEAENKEIELIKKYNSNKKKYGYNISNGGNTIGKHSEETKRLIGEKAKGRKQKTKKIICEGVLYESIKECAEYYGVNSNTLKSWANGTSHMPQEWYDRELHQEGKTMDDYIIQGGRHGNPKAVICENREFKSCDECSEYYGIISGTMKNWLNGRNPMPLEWYNKGLRYKEKSMEDYKIQQIKEEDNVICENKIFNSSKECADYYNLDVYTLRRWLNFEVSMPQKFYDMGLRYESNSMEDYSRRNREYMGIKQVVCEDIVFENIVECANYYNDNSANLANYLNGRTTMPKEWFDRGLRFIDKTMEDYTIRPESHVGENSLLPTNPIICEGKIFYSLRDFVNNYPQAKNVFAWLNGKSSMPKEWEKKGLKYLDGHTDDIIIYQDEEYWERVHKNRSESQKGHKPSNAFSVYCEDKVFDTVTKCAEYYEVNVGTMKGWINGSSAMPLEWYEKGLRREDKEMSDYKIQSQSKRVICDGIIFKSIKDCAKHYGYSSITFNRWLKGQTPMPQEFKDKGLKFYE